MHDLGLSEPDIPNRPREFAADAAKNACLLALLWIASMFAGFMAGRALDYRLVLLSIPLLFGSFWWALTRQRRLKSTLVVAVHGDRTKQARQLAAVPVLCMLGAIVAGALNLVVLAVPLVIAALVVAFAVLRERAVPVSADHVRAFMPEAEIPQADAIAVDDSRKWHADAKRVIAVTNERVLLASAYVGEESFIYPLGFNEIERFEVGWHFLGNFGSLTLHFRHPLAELDGRRSIKLSGSTPRNIARVASALRAHGVDGPVVGPPRYALQAESEYSPPKRKLRKLVGRTIKIIFIVWLAVTLLLFALVGLLRLFSVDLRQLDNRLQQQFGDTYPADGRSNLTGGGASIEYPASADLVELILDEDWDDGPNDGARWELRSKASDGYNVVSLSNYVFVPLLDNPAAVRRWVAGKQAEREELAGAKVSYTTTKVDGRTGYVWDHPGEDGYWFYAAWFPNAAGTIRLECIAKKQRVRFEKLCMDALKTLKFNGT